MTSRLRRSAKRRYRTLLVDDQLLDAFVGQRDHRVELGARVRGPFSRGLQLDDPSVLAHDAVEVGRSLEVLRVIEVEPWDAVDHAAAHCRYVVTHGDALEHPRVLHLL